MAIDLFSIGPFTVHGYGLMIGIGFIVAILVGCWRAKAIGLSEDHLVNLAIWVLIIGFLGGKLMYTIVNFKAFLENPLRVISSEGFVVYGGIITGVLTIIVYCRIKKIPVLKYLDLITAIVTLNQGFGRIGCFMAGCCYGRQTDAWYGVIFPEGCLAPAGVKLIPAQLIMALGDFLIFAILMYLSTKCKTDGVLCGSYLLLYSIGRFLVEFIRNDDERGFVGALSTSQFIAIWIAVLAIAFIVFLQMRAKKAVASETAEAEAPSLEEAETTETTAAKTEVVAEETAVEETEANN